MTYNIEAETGLLLNIDYEAIAHEVINAVLDYEKCPYETEVNLILTNNEEIHKINREYRQIDRATDVLSFPLVEYENPSDFDLDNRLDCFNPDTGELMLGDIIISQEMVLSQAKSYNHSVKREFAFLIAHSMLHLCGYDHMEPDEAMVMETKQREILEELNINR